MRRFFYRKQVAWLILKHVKEERLDKANVKVIDAYNQLALPKLWTSGKRASATAPGGVCPSRTYCPSINFAMGDLAGLATAKSRHVHEDATVLYPHLVTALETLNADIAAARVREVESTMHDILQAMNNLGISLKQLTDCRRSRLPARANETRYRHPQTGKTWNGRGKSPEWLRGKVWGRFSVDPPLSTDAGLKHETQS